MPLVVAQSAPHSHVGHWLINHLFYHSFNRVIGYIGEHKNGKVVGTLCFSSKSAFIQGRVETE